MEYQINNDDIIALKKQINISDEKAKELLTSYNGDIVEIILNFYEKQDEKDYSDKINQNEDLDKQIDELNICDDRNTGINTNKPQDNLKVLRQILDEKDTIIQNNKKEEVDLSAVKLYEYIQFNFNSKTYRKQQIHTNRDLLLNNVVKNYLIEQYEKTDRIKDKELKLVCRPLKEKAIKMLKKWNLQQPFIFYFEHQVRFDKHPRTNELATKFLKYSNHFKDYENLIGPVVLIDYWE